MHTVKVKKGFNRARLESESECEQGSEYQTVKHKENPKSEMARTRTRVGTGKWGGYTEKKLNNQQIKTSRKYKYQTYRQTQENQIQNDTGIRNLRINKAGIGIVNIQKTNSRGITDCGL